MFKTSCRRVRILLGSPGKHVGKRERAAAAVSVTLAAGRGGGAVAQPRGMAPTTLCVGLLHSA